ncbi:hypothetical protein NESM_000823100 [Novymonas esmeraldas]|uniref:Uncharacterized protein n=1 Tax=Novymonas esmeraldas TaxID=1808958 RepID=A0AAW0EYJ0_9TRYP
MSTSLLLRSPSVLRGVGASTAAVTTVGVLRSHRRCATTTTTAGAQAEAKGFSFSTYRTYRQERSARRGQRYSTLSMYLDRLPPGLRELLLWSPLLALLFFTCRQARVYYLEPDEPWYYVALPRRWRGRAAPSLSLLQRAPRSGDAWPVTVGVDAAGAQASATATRSFSGEGVVDTTPTAALADSPPVPPFHTVRVRCTAPTTEAAAAAAAASATPLEAQAVSRHRHGVWGAPLQVLRDPATQHVVGYTTVPLQ